VDLPKDLRAALDDAVARVPVTDIATAVDRLIARYRTGGEAGRPILTSVADVTAYAAYRMPATYAAVRAALTQVALAAPALAPRSLLDVGGGTGAASWAAADTYPTITDITVIDQVAEALALGRQLSSRTSALPLPTATWRQARIDAVDLPPADLVMISYVLGELAGVDRSDLVRRAAATGDVTVIVEPGTPAGYGRILAARAALIDGGLSVVAPCPHQGRCPMQPGQDWCHFAARVNRSALHRRLKNAELGYEDEKFSYVATARAPAATPPGRVLRHPQQRKGLVSLQVCTSADGIVREQVSKRQGDSYRAARDVAWGDAWPPPAQPPPAQPPPG